MSERASRRESWTNSELCWPESPDKPTVTRVFDLCAALYLIPALLAVCAGYQLCIVTSLFSYHREGIQHQGGPQWDIQPI